MKREHVECYNVERVQISGIEGLAQDFGEAFGVPLDVGIGKSHLSIEAIPHDTHEPEFGHALDHFIDERSRTTGHTTHAGNGFIK